MKTHELYKDESKFNLIAQTIGTLLNDGSAYRQPINMSSFGLDFNELLSGDIFFLTMIDIIDVDSHKASVSRYPDYPNKIDLKLIAFYFANALDDLARMLPFTVNGNFGLLGILSYENKMVKRLTPIEGGKYLFETLNNTRINLQHNTGVRLSILLGELIEDISMLHREYSRIESSSAEEFTPAIGMPEVKFIREQDRKNVMMDDEAFHRLTQLEISLSKSAAARDFEKVSHLFKKILETEIAVFPAQKNIIEKSIARLSMIYSLSGTPPHDPDIPSLSFYSWMTSMRNAVTMQDVLDDIQLTISSIQEYHFPRGQASSGKISEIISFIDENYMEPDICSSVICEKFNINISTFSRQFKEKTGTKFIDYLHKKRIDSAIKLLTENTDLTMDEISEKVGYSSILTFFRAFKRLEGKTPGTCRLEYLQGHNIL